MLQALVAALAFNRYPVVAVEGLDVAQPARQQEVEQRPQLAEVVFQRGAAQAQALACNQLAGRLGGLAAGVLDVLRLVQHQQVQRQFCQVLNVLGQQSVGGQDHVVVVEVRKVLFARGAIQRQHLELRGEVRGFVQPVGDQAGGHHHHRRAIQAASVLFAQNMRQCLQGLAQAHVIGQHAAHLQLAQGLHPAQAFELIGAQIGIQPFGGFDAEILDVTQALGEAANLLAAFPTQGQGIQRVEARCIGTFDPQRSGVRLAQIKLVQSGQYWFESPIRQRNLQRTKAAGRVGRDIDQDQFVILASGQFFAVEQVAVGAHQVEQDRQQAQVLAIDDDAQLQVEPVAFRGFIDSGIPVFDRGQVKAEIFIDLQLPALIAQALQLVEGEIQPGAVIDQLKQLASAFRQGLALTRGDFETQAAQLLAVAVFDLGLALDAQGLLFLAQQDVSVFLPAHVLVQVVERQGGAVLDIALHFAVARLESAEFGTGQPQSRYWLDVLDQLFWQIVGAT